MPKTINRAQYQQLLGLAVLAEKHDQAMDDIHEAVRDITGEADTIGNSSDFVYSDRDVDRLLTNLEITVEE